jgi:hypothetical protein
LVERPTWVAMAGGLAGGCCGGSRPFSHILTNYLVPPPRASIQCFALMLRYVVLFAPSQLFFAPIAGSNRAQPARPTTMIEALLVR